MKKREKDSINWLFNQDQLMAAIQSLGARNLTAIEALTIEAGIPDKEDVLATYDAMVQYDESEAVEKIKEWAQKINKKFGHQPGVKYIYFRLKRWN